MSSRQRYLECRLLLTFAFTFVTWCFLNVLVSRQRIINSRQNNQMEEDFIPNVIVSESGKDRKRYLNVFERVQIEDGMRTSANVSPLVVNGGSPLLVLFTTWLEDPAKFYIHNSTVRNWKSLRPWVQPVVFTDQLSIIQQVRQHGWKTLPMQRLSPTGKPILKDMYEAVDKRFPKPEFIAFSNADILYTSSLLDTLRSLLRKAPDLLHGPTMIAGARTNVENLTANEVSTSKSLSTVASSRGRQFPFFGSVDYFIMTRTYPYSVLPDVAVGLPEYDKFMIWFSNKSNFSTIDVTNTMLAVHWTTPVGNYESGLSKEPFQNRRIFQPFKGFNKMYGTLHCTKYIAARLADKTNNIVLVRREVRIGRCDYRPLCNCPNACVTV